MKRRDEARVSIAVLLSCLTLGAILPSIGLGQGTNREEILNRARRSYYNLRKEGLIAYECQLIPDWEVVLADEKKSDPSAYERGMKVLQQLQFRVSLGSDDAVKITHTEVAADNDAQAKSLQRIYGGMEQMINGIYASTSPFLLTSVFPPEGSQYNLEVIGGGYRLKYKEGTADIATTMGRDYGVTELKVSTPEFISSIQPQYAKTPKGLLISGYQADYAGRSGADQVQVRLGVQMSYQEVAGLQLFQRLNVIATIGSSTNRVEVQFRGCQVKKN